MRQILARTSSRTILAKSNIQAGSGIEMSADFHQVDLNSLVTGNREGFFLVEVTGDSQAPTIQPGYLIFVDSWAEPMNGDMIAADVNGLTCVKTFRRNPSGLYLISANKKYKPRKVVSTDNFRVLGVVKGHLALYRRV